MFKTLFPFFFTASKRKKTRRHKKLRKSKTYKMRGG